MVSGETGGSQVEEGSGWGKDVGTGHHIEYSTTFRNQGSGDD